jgi:hypothetical protein
MIDAMCTTIVLSRRRRRNPRAKGTAWAALLGLLACCFVGCGSDPPTSSDGSVTSDATGLDGAMNADAVVHPDGSTVADAGPYPDGSVGPDASDPCVNIAPSTDPAVNHSNIITCLTGSGSAQLAAGDFPVAQVIDMPNGSVLTGNATRPRIAMTATAQTLIQLNDDNEVSHLTLDGNHFMTVAHNAIVRFSGNRGDVHENEIINATGATGDDKVTGLRFWTTTGVDNHAYQNHVHHVHYGVIFDLYPNGANNVLEENEIHDIRCDAVTFRGFGIALNNTIYHSGWQCLNPASNPIPGGGFYTLQNDQGAEMVGNHVYQVCGTPLDLDRASHLVITDNMVQEPGWIWDGHTHCGSGHTAHLLDISESLIERNTIHNDCRHTVSYDPNHVFSADGSGVPTDLPAGANTAIAFALTHRDGGAWLTTHNTLNENTFIASCVAPALGLGYFAGRGTGYDAAGAWSAVTTNYYLRNDPFGANYGSKRCGGNWYAGNSTCDTGNMNPDCNLDDDQHNGVGHDAFRNDNCGHYN